MKNENDIKIADAEHAEESAEPLSIHERLDDLEARLSAVEDHTKIEKKPRARARKK